MSSILYGIWIIGVFLIVVWSMRAERDPKARHEGYFGFLPDAPSEKPSKTHSGSSTAAALAVVGLTVVGVGVALLLGGVLAKLVDASIGRML